MNERMNEWINEWMKKTTHVHVIGIDVVRLLHNRRAPHVNDRLKGKNNNVRILTVTKWEQVFRPVAWNFSGRVVREGGGGGVKRQRSGPSRYNISEGGRRYLKTKTYDTKCFTNHKHKKEKSMTIDNEFISVRMIIWHLQTWIVDENHWYTPIKYSRVLLTCKAFVNNSLLHTVRQIIRRQGPFIHFLWCCCTTTVSFWTPLWK